MARSEGRRENGKKGPAYGVLELNGIADDELEVREGGGGNDEREFHGDCIRVPVWLIEAMRVWLIEAMRVWLIEALCVLQSNLQRRRVDQGFIEDLKA